MKTNLVNNLLKLCEENLKKPHFNPFISYPGVKKPINTVNKPNLPLHFLSRHDNFIIKGFNLEMSVNNRK